MNETASPQAPDGSRVRIRMYRQGLGDCFLLTFYSDHTPRHVLIDCGVLLGAPAGQDKIRKVARSIETETGGKLDALVATHEHWDHVSGFYDAKDIFGPMKVEEIWVAWTEDPSDPTAQNLKRRNQLKLQAINMALDRLAKSDGPHLQAYGPGVAALLGFYGGPVEGVFGFSDKTAEAMQAVTRRDPAPTYWKPGDLIQPKWLPGVRIYVLGPPLDPNMIKKEGGKPGTETYGLTGADSAFAVALEAARATENATDDPGRAESLAAALPFHPSLQWQEKKDEDKILNNRLFKPLYQAYMAEAADWRRIDADWLLSAARLGLQLDNATNNTSLVLAIEFIDTGAVLLFAADAQIGSWKSWLDLKWNLKDSGAGAKAVTTADLLRHTVFYKVGHHGSHNATLKEGGLEAMAAPGLVAAIPVDQEFANHSKHWQMPAAALFARLQELSLGRILRADTPWPTTEDQPPQGLSAQEWQRFVESTYLDPDDLFIDYYVR